MKKRLRMLAWILTLTMLCELLPFSAFAQSDIGQNFTSSVFSLLDEENSEALALGECGDNLKWSLSSDGTLSITGTGEMTNYDILNPAPWLSTSSIKLSIKSVIFSDGITSIGNFAFYSCSNISSATIPATITKIGQFAFQTASESRLSITYNGTTAQWQAIAIEQNNDALDSAIINGHAIIVDSGNCGSDGDNVTWELDNAGVLTIRGTGAIKDYNYSPFSNGITSIVIEDGITRIGSDAFRGLKIKDVSLPDSLTQIGDDAFRGSSLEELTLPEGVKVIGDWAFLGTNLKSIALPSSLIRLGSCAFYKCANLSSVTFSSSPTFIYSSTFAYCTALESIVIPYGVQCIDSQAFYNCTSLTSVTIPSTLVRVSDKAFYNSNVTDVYYEGTKSQSNQINILGSNEPFSNANWHYQDLAFTFKRDNLSFLNNGNYFFNDWERIYNNLHKYFGTLVDYVNQKYGSGDGNQYLYQISDAKFKQLTSGLEPRVIDYLQHARARHWGGSCEGMSRIVMLHYLHPELLPLDNGATVYELNAPKDDSSVENFVNYYYLLQYLPVFKYYYTDTVTRYTEHFSDELHSIVQDLQNRNPVLVDISTDNNEDHAIVFLGIEDETFESWIINAYDPNYLEQRQVILLKDFYQNSSNHRYPKIEYVCGKYSFTHIKCHTLSKDYKLLDCRNYFGLSDDYLMRNDFDDSHIVLNDSHTDITMHYGNTFVRTENGKLEYSDDLLVSSSASITTQTLPSSLEFTFPKRSNETFELELTPDDGNSATSDILLADTLFSISASGAVKLTYDEQNRTVDVKSSDGTPIQVNMSFTQNEPSESWPWHSWALDTTGTTTLHADLDDDGLHLSGDGITNAKYATENADTENVDSGTISVQPDADGITTVTITNKKSSSGDSLEIVTPSAPTTGNAITITNGFAYIDDPEQPVNSAALGDVVTIVANDRSSEGKTFTGWVVNSGDVTLNDSSASPTSFTMGDKAVSITAQYSTNSTPTPTPGGGSSSGSGGGGGGGAAVLIGVGAAAAITAGVIMMSPVEIKGRVVLADQAAVPGAKISLLREGKVVAQTTADENGSFSLKAKRGSYELTAAYTTADGQLIYKTIDIKAPAKDLTVTF